MRSILCWVATRSRAKSVSAPIVSATEATIVPQSLF
jgi:hypothetical protein